MHEYKDLKSLTNVTAGALLIYMVARLALLGVTIWAYRAFLGSGNASVALGLVGISAMVFVFALLGCVVLVLRWIYRASANAHALSNEMTISPGWAIGWYFIPIANLFKPYQAMCEIWMASHFRDNWRGKPSPLLVTGWWSLWVVVTILDNVAITVSILDLEGPVRDMSTLLDPAAAILNVGLCLILILLMRRVASAQNMAPHKETFA